jgi:anaphase-promoting complex subunit 5
MSRYLTPPKIALLVLVGLYCESAVPSSGTVPILSFIASRLIPTSSSFPNTQKPSRNQDFEVSIADFEAVTLTQSSSVPGRTLFDLFIKKLWAINSCDALHSFFESLKYVVVRTKEQAERDAETGNAIQEPQIVLSRTSPLGTFVRRAWLEFTRLQFHDSVSLWTAFLKYREPTAAAWRRRNPNVPGLGFDVNMDELELGPGDQLFEAAYGHLSEPATTDEMVSTDDIERLLEFQADRLQR